MRFINLFKDENIQTQILDAALKFVPEHGWTKTAIENGIDEMKLPKISAGIISNGPIDLVHHRFEKSKFRSLAKLLSLQGSSGQIYGQSERPQKSP